MKNIFTASIVAASLMMAFSASAVTNGNQNIDFTANVIDTGCDFIVAPGHTVASQAAASIDLKTADRASLGTTIGSTANKTPFALTLSNCPVTILQVGAAFDFTSDSVNEDYLKNDETVQTGVAMQLYDDSNGGEVLKKNAPSVPVATNGGSAVLPFTVSLVNTVGNGVAPGPVSAHAQYTLQYN